MSHFTEQFNGHTQWNENLKEKTVSIEWISEEKNLHGLSVGEHVFIGAIWEWARKRVKQEWYTETIFDAKESLWQTKKQNSKYKIDIQAPKTTIVNIFSNFLVDYATRQLFDSNIHDTKPAWSKAIKYIISSECSHWILGSFFSCSLFILSVLFVLHLLSSVQFFVCFHFFVWVERFLCAISMYFFLVLE